jgi:plasmid stabilization system protein ParE
LKVYWTDTAEKHLDSIYNYIVQHSELYAKKTVDRLTKKSIQIADFPLSGRIVPEFEMDQIREVFDGPYRIIYHLKPDQIDVIAVLHGYRNVKN